MQLLDQKGDEPPASGGPLVSDQPSTTCARVPVAKMWFPAARHNPARCDDEQGRALGTRPLAFGALRDAAAVLNGPAPPCGDAPHSPAAPSGAHNDWPAGESLGCPTPSRR